MNIRKLILAGCTIGLFAYAIGWGCAWFFGAESPFLFGIGLAALFVSLAMLTGNGPGAAQTGDIVEAPLFNTEAIGESDHVFLEKRKRPE